jgi:hypothetical protein
VLADAADDAAVGAIVGFDCAAVEFEDVEQPTKISDAQTVITRPACHLAA